MAPISSKAARSSVKLMLIGNSGSGKTGALTSLVKAGYKLRILDTDNGLDSLINHVKDECPELLDNIDYQSFRDPYTVGVTGPMVKGQPKAAINLVKALDKWDDGSTPADWDDKTILVLDSLTGFGQSCYAWARAMNPTSKEKRQWYGAAQELLESTIASLTAEAFMPHVIVITHIDMREQADGTVAGFASAIGEALGPKLPRYFNTMILSETTGSGSSVRRTLRTRPTALIALKTPAPMRIDERYPIETGLHTLFEKLKTQP